MTITEIVLILLGVAAVFVSFIVPERKDENSLEGIDREELKRLFDIECDNARSRIESITDETVNYSIEKTERTLDKISNDKIMALGEYSDTVMNQISTNHQETVFLHDMLNQNKNDLTVMLGQAINDSREAAATASEAINVANEAIDKANEAKEMSEKASDNAVIAERTMINARKAINEISDNDSSLEEASIEEPKEKEVVKKKPKKKTKASAKTETVIEENGLFMDNDGQISLNFDSGVEETSNNNAKVLKLHKQGKSNVAIAKELGLGVGEVKLVINLFENK